MEIKEIKEIYDDEATCFGQLRVEVVSGRQLKDKDTVGKQDPYCSLQLGDCKARTRTHENGGSEPIWKEAFTFDLWGGNHDHELLVQCFDADGAASEIIGKTTVRVSYSPKHAIN